MLKGIEHIGLSVSDLDRSVEFYRDIIGLELIRILEPGSVPLDKVINMPGSTARIAHMQSEKAMLELFEYKEPQGRPLPEDHTQADKGFIHMGFTSTDARADYKTMKDKGVRFVGKPVEIRPDVWIFYFYGPDDEVCEVRQT
jgi:catechol 2,3-dioxygenase-like lactoylglutathione lyase family enzyme